MSKKVIRTPVQVKPTKAWANPQALQRVMGIDPGFAETGLVILERPHPKLPPALVTARTITTKKATKKERTNLRVTNDDQRRYREIWTALEQFRVEFSPYAVGLEAYRVFQGRGGNAWKTAVVYGGVIFWAHSRDLYVAPFLPTDLKKRFCNKKSASKGDVEAVLCQLVPGLAVALDSVAAGRREHIADAAGHAYLVMEEVAEHRKMLGLV